MENLQVSGEPKLSSRNRLIGLATSSCLIGIEAVRVDIEAQIVGTLRRFAVVGLPDGVLRESKDRVRCAIENSGFPFPSGEVVVNLSPAGLPKAGAGFDLGMALSILVADYVVPPSRLEDFLVLGELGLDGALRPTRGVLAAACLARDEGGLELLVSPENVAEALLVPEIKVRAVRSLPQAVAFLRGHIELPYEEAKAPGTVIETHPLTFSDVVGQHSAKRALEIVAAGGHNLLMVGPPGSGKSMLAERLPSILPPLSFTEQLEVTKVHSAFANAQNSGGINYRTQLSLHRPFRSPHHSTSSAGLVGGGSIPCPGEISLAHGGVLFLDEVTELRREALEALRQPLESRKVTLSRARYRLSFPANFVLVAAMNPCPCGKFGAGEGVCACPPNVRSRYNAKLSGPIVDRIDLQVWVGQIPLAQLQAGVGEDPTEGMKARVLVAREIQSRRLGGERSNAAMKPSEVGKYCQLDNAAAQALREASEAHRLSARSYHRVLKVARTVADLDGSEQLTAGHIEEVISYRVNQLKE